MTRNRKKEENPMKKHEHPVEDTANPAENINPGNEKAMTENDPADQASGTDHAEDLQKQVSELNDRYLRLYSEFDNYRKRTLKEKIEQSKFASSDVISKLLPVLDDFERAIRAFDVATDAGQALKDGLVLIFNKFLTTLNQEGLEQMKTTGEPFDTDFHEAITNIPVQDPEMKGKIVDEVEKGYLLNGKVLRYAKVVVGN
jgi:molecular chaperone GrpE